MERRIQLWVTALVILANVLTLSGCGGGSSSGSSITFTPAPTAQLSLPTNSVLLNSLGGVTAAALLTIKVGTAASWTAQTNTSWIHLTDTTGTTAALGSVVRFTYDANSGTTRIGAITFQGTTFAATLTVTQAGTGYTPAVPPTLPTLTTIPLSNEVLPPFGLSFVADIAGNLFYLDATGNTVYEWIAASGSTVSFALPTTADTTAGMAVDENQNFFFSPKTSSAPVQVCKWILGQASVTWVSSGLPAGFAVVGATTDLHGDVYVYGNINYATSLSVFVLTSSGQASSAPTLVFPQSYAGPGGLIADAAGKLDVFSALSGGYSIVQGDPLTGSIKYIAGAGRTQVPFGGLSGSYYPTFGTFGLDGSGHFYLGIYVANQAGSLDQDYLGLWEPELPGTVDAGVSAATLRTRVASGVQSSIGDGLGNIYVESLVGAIQKFTPVYINTAAILEPATAGSGETSPVLPAITPINAVSNQTWLTITGQSNGTITFSFTATTVARTAVISVLSQNLFTQFIYVSQAAP